MTKCKGSSSSFFIFYFFDGGSSFVVGLELTASSFRFVKQFFCARGCGRVKVSSL